jgi:heat shock protein HslJ
MRAFLFLLLLLSGCAAGPVGRPMNGILWRASDINGVPLVANSAVTLRLDDGRVSGSAGCNQFSGTYRMMNKDGIDLGALSTTRMACAPELMEQERRVLAILDAVEGYSFYSDGGLSLISPDGRAIRFRR